MIFFNNKNFFIFFIFIVHLPIFFINNIWDGAIVDYGFTIENLRGVQSWYSESSSNFQFYIIKLLFFVKNIMSLPNELIFDCFTLIFLFLFCLEVKKLSEKIFNFNKNYSKICFLIAFIFPVWNSLTEINLGLYLFCFYLAIFGYRLFSNKNLLIKIIGIILIFCSFSIKSNFAFVLGLSLTENFYNFLNKKKIDYFASLTILIISISGYLINIIYFPPYGIYEGYNQVQFNYITIEGLIKNFKDYLSFFIYFLTIPLFFILGLKLILKKKIIFFDQEIIKISLSLLLLSGVSLSPYLLVQKSVDIFNFLDFESRHVYLLSVSFPIFLTFLIKVLRDKISLSASSFFKYLIFLQCIVLLSTSYLVKYNATLIDKNLVNSFQNLQGPKTGYVVLLSDNLLYRTSYGLNSILYKAKNKAAWVVKVFKKTDNNTEFNKDNFLSNAEFKIFSKESYSIKYIYNDFEYKCITIYELDNEIEASNYLKKLYFLNQDKYFTINKVREIC